MKVIQELAAVVERWWPFNQPLPNRLQPKPKRGAEPLASLKFPARSISASSPTSSSPVVNAGSTYGGGLSPLPVKPSPCRAIKRRKGIRHPKLAFVLTALTLTAILGQRFYNQPGLQVGSVAPETIFAPAEVRVEDKETTEERRRDARNGALPVLKIDTSINETVLKSLGNLLAQVSSIRQEAGVGLFTSTSTLSTPIQKYLSQADDAVWLKLRSLITPLSEMAPGESSKPEELEIMRREQTLTPAQQKAIDEFWAYRQRSSPQEFSDLLGTVERSRQSYQQAMANLALMSAQVEGMPSPPQLFDLNYQAWAEVETSIRKAAERILAQGISSGLPPEILHRAVDLQIQGTVPRPLEELASALLLTVLQPNLIEDPDRTRIQADMAAEAVKPIFVEVQRGEMIVASGDSITRSHFVLLDNFNLSQRRFNYWGLATFGGLVGGGVAIFLLVEQWVPYRLRQQDYLLLTAMVVSTGVLKMFGAAAYGLPAIGLLAGSFYGPVLGGTLVTLLAVLLPLGANVGGVSFAAGAAGALVCSILAGRMRSREELALLGGGVGLTQAVVYLLLTLIVNPISLLSAWSGILIGAAWQGIYGVISSIAALGLSPYLEHAFDLVTPIRLAELSNPNRPMLKRLASEAPGTFQHTLFVSSLAEAAARALGCNVELVRAGTLYHDIGKMHDPLGFIENQMGGTNKHDDIQDPWLSAAIIKKHVTEGQVMARKCRLPKALQGFIPEHQGTMQISYFYHQAQEMAKTDPAITVCEADFRYDGPIPQSPETGIVMLADSCEAALRSLTEATPEEALAMVNRILRARWKDDQLIESGLTREHMAVIADIFVRVWQQYNHKRIAYPKAALAPKS